MMRGRAVSPSASGETITAPARVASSFARWRLPVKKLMWRASADSSEATWWISVSAPAAARPPSRATICASVIGPAMAPTARSLGRRLAVQRLDHLVGEVDARAGVDGVLEDDVVLLLLRDLADDAVRLLHDLGELLVAARVQVLAELALLPLEVAVQLPEFALLRSPLRFAHRDAVLLEVVLHALELVGEACHLLVALLELSFDFLLRALGERGVAQDALGVDETELARESGPGAGGRRGGGVFCERRTRAERGADREEAEAVHESAVFRIRYRR